MRNEVRRTEEKCWRSLNQVEKKKRDLESIGATKVLVVFVKVQPTTPQSETLSPVPWKHR